MAADTLTCQGTGGGGSLGNDGRAVWRMEVADLGGSTGLGGRRAGGDRAGRRRYLLAGVAPTGGRPQCRCAPHARWPAARCDAAPLQHAHTRAPVTRTAPTPLRMD